MNAEQKKRSTYRTATGRIRSIIWILLLPAAAECIASVWFPSVSIGDLDLQLAALNVTGALLEGFFAAWEHDAVEATGPLGELLSFLADDMRGSFLSTYTSWAGMVGFAAALAHARGSLAWGLAYLLCCVQLGFVAHAVGHAVATSLFPVGSRADAESRSPRRPPFETSYLHDAVLGGVVAFICATYSLVRTDVADYEDADLAASDAPQLPALFPALFHALDVAHARLLVGMLFSIAGAYTGNALGGAVDRRRGPARAAARDVPAGTLACNALFAVLGTAPNVAALRRASWRRSALLQAFAGSFCGAASAFAGHASDGRALYRRGGARPVLRNAAANLAAAGVAFLLAFEVERLLSVVGEVDRNSDGVVQVDEVLSYYRMDRVAARE